MKVKTMAAVFDNKEVIKSVNGLTYSADLAYSGQI